MTPDLREYYGDAVCSKCHKEISYGVARVTKILCRECDKPQSNIDREVVIRALKNFEIKSEKGKCLVAKCAKDDGIYNGIGKDAIEPLADAILSHIEGNEPSKEPDLGEYIKAYAQSIKTIEKQSERIKKLEGALREVIETNHSNAQYVDKLSKMATIAVKILEE